MSELPKIIPIFPLPNFVLFPTVTVPLHIFEPRYREMITDVADTHGLIGMILLKGSWQGDYTANPDYRANPDIFQVGCIGRIGNLQRLPDGRFNIALAGISEYRIRREIREKSYRQAEIEWCPAEPAQLEMDDEAMEGLRQLLFEYLGDKAAAAWRAIVEQRHLRDAELLNFLCFHLDVSPIEKQTLLEAREQRLDCLFDVLTFNLEERRQGGSGPRGGGTVQ